MKPRHHMHSKREAYIDPPTVLRALACGCGVGHSAYIVFRRIGENIDCVELC
jgi:hypothetical protein